MIAASNFEKAQQKFWKISSFTDDTKSKQTAQVLPHQCPRSLFLLSLPTYSILALDELE